MAPNAEAHQQAQQERVSPICEVPQCLGLNDGVPGGVEGINCITYQTETGTRVVWLCDTHRATVTNAEGHPLDIEVVEGGVWGREAVRRAAATVSRGLRLIE